MQKMASRSTVPLATQVLPNQCGLNDKFVCKHKLETEKFRKFGKRFVRFGNILVFFPNSFICLFVALARVAATVIKPIPVPVCAPAL